MSIDSRFIPPHMRKLMSPEEQAKLEEASQKAVSRREREEQKIFNAWLNNQVRERRLYAITPRSDKVSTIRVGHPDYTIFCPGARMLLLEMKADGGRLSEEQQDCVGRIAELGFQVEIPWSASRAINLVQEFLK